MDRYITIDYEAQTKRSTLTISKLPYFECSIDANAPVSELTEIFKRTQNLPGAVILNKDTCVGMISREKCFEALGRPFGVELFLKRPVGEFLQKNGGNPLIVPETTSIREAVDLALVRSSSELYDPIIISTSKNQRFRLIDMRTLLKAQSDLLAGLFLEVEKLSIIDPLTGLLNRRGFFSQAQKKVDLARQTNSDIAVMMVDIDLFKTVNDIYGHQVGDRVIHEIASQMKRTLRESDLVGRYGGEEYIGLLSNIDVNESYIVAERLRERIESLIIQTEFYNINTTVSIGVCHLNAGSMGMESLFSRADKALYEAKTSGRNQVILWQNSSLYLPQSPRPVIVETTNKVVQDHDFETTRAYDETIKGWARALEMRDNETEGHATRAMTLAVRMAQALGLSPEECEDIRRGALLHDIGKIALPDSILFKEGKLESDEWEVMKKHPVYAYGFLSPISFLEKVLDIPYCHHEHWDGTGYPRGLKGESIPLAARIFTIIDVWDALLSDRRYRPAWKKEDAIQYLQDEAGKLFDPSLIPIFLGIIEQFQMAEVIMTETVDY
jgi:diguanylate cyclase (GGDEF)-like protein